MNKKSLSYSLLVWFNNNKRQMPWRENKNFYNIWLSEIMLQQTQVKTVIPYFNKWIKKFPTIKSIANADEDIILKYWEGLGYYARARNFKKACNHIYLKNIDINKITFEEFLSFPGVGVYTASAVFSIAKNQVYHVVDGNVKRVLSRILRFKKNPNFHLKQIDSFLLKNIPKKNPGDFNQALMELGAMICKPNNPECSGCPISKNCKSYKKKDFDLAKITKKNKEKYFILKVYKKNQKYLLVKNTRFNFLKNLAIFPMEELSNPKNFNENLNFKMSNMNMNIKIEYLKNAKRFPSSYWFDKRKLDNYMLPTFTKKVVKYLEKK